MLMGMAKPTKPMSNSKYGVGKIVVVAIPFTAAIKPANMMYSSANIMMPVNTAWLILAANLTLAILLHSVV